MQNNQELKYLALGDSYTIGESVPEELRWPEQLVKKLRQNNIYFEDPQFIAKTGWRTDDLLKAIQKQGPDKNNDLVSLQIGVNNQYKKRPIEIYEEEFEILLQKAISLTTGDDPKKIVVVSIPDYGYTPFGEAMQEQISKELEEYNSLNKQITGHYGAWYIDITDISRRKDEQLIAEDKLHPSGQQYNLWAERIIKNEDLINDLLKNK